MGLWTIDGCMENPSLLDFEVYFSFSVDFCEDGWMGGHGNGIGWWALLV